MKADWNGASPWCSGTWPRGRRNGRMNYRSREMGMNLDESLEGRLDKALGGTWDELPRGLAALWEAEPR